MKKLFVILFSAVLFLAGCGDREPLTPPDDIITAEQAQNIVFEKAGVEAQDVTNLQTNLDYDDSRRIWEYEIEFDVGTSEYDSEVNAKDGTVIKFEHDKY